ncbi:hypothetical protein M413DRAFT_11095 [Hebeloma cylindrosporum]|uniref:Uncharacterized protein n=1 Tax=Hebeloma cylindrosporum TaxID=76867 RepID=A0A0C2XV90_HEBCY|nr:hypothetical protein M413DRAFT_11095 [Hebeloma cylindrosporum h7]
MLFIKKKFWRSIFRWTVPGKSRTLSRSRKHPIIIAPLSRSSIDKLQLEHTLNDARSRSQLSDDSHLHDTTAPPSFISNPDPSPYEPSAEPNEHQLHYIEDFQIHRATRVKLASSLPRVETIAPSESKSEILSDSIPLQSSDSELVPLSVLAPVSEAAPLPSQGEHLETENYDDISVSQPAAAAAATRCPAIRKNASTIAPLTAVRFAASTFTGPTHRPAPRMYDYNVARPRPGYRTVRSALQRSDSKTFTVPAHLKNPSLNSSTELSEVNSILFPEFPNPDPLEPTAQPIVSSDRSGDPFKDIPYISLRQRYHSASARIPLTWTPPSGLRHLYHSFQLSGQPGKWQWVYIGPSYGPPPGGIKAMVPAQAWGYAEGWYFSNDGSILIQHCGPVPKTEECEPT